MADTVSETSFVVRFFEDFYTAVHAFKNRVLKQHWISPERDLVPSAESTAKVILDELKEILQKQALQAPRHGGEFAANYYREAQYIMAAMADEIFLHLKWDGRQYWEDHLLESQLFSTHTAGETLYKSLDRFLLEREPIRADIAHVYLMVLGLGFRGKYRGVDDRGRIASYKQQLYTFIFHRDPALVTGETTFCAQAYNYTFEEGRPKSLHDFRSWGALFAGFLMLLLFVSFVIWHHHTSPLDQVLANITIEHDNLVRRTL